MNDQPKTIRGDTLLTCLYFFRSIFSWPHFDHPEAKNREHVMLMLNVPPLPWAVAWRCFNRMSDSEIARILDRLILNPADLRFDLRKMVGELVFTSTGRMDDRLAGMEPALNQAVCRFLLAIESGEITTADIATSYDVPE